MFSGLCAFPLTPMREPASTSKPLPCWYPVPPRLAWTPLACSARRGTMPISPGTNAAQLLEASVDAADGVPILAGVGAVRTRDVLAYADDAQTAGASALLLAPVSYQRLTRSEVLGLFEDVAAESSLPIVVYDNPATTGFTFTDDLHTRIADLRRRIDQDSAAPAGPGF